MTRQEIFEQFRPIEEELKAKYALEEEKLLFRIGSLELQVAALKAENDKVWKIFVEQLAEEKIKNRKLQENYRAVLEHGKAEGMI